MTVFALVTSLLFTFVVCTLLDIAYWFMVQMFPFVFFLLAGAGAFGIENWTPPLLFHNSDPEMIVGNTNGDNRDDSGGTDDEIQNPPGR